MDAFLALSERLKGWIDLGLGGVSALMMIALTLFALLEIVRRYIFDVTFEWGQDALIVGMITAVALYLCVTQVRRGHLVMGAVVQALHARGMLASIAVLRTLVSAIIVVFCGAIGITGWPTLSYALARDLTTYSLLIPLWPFYLLLMFGFLMMAFVALLQLVEDVIALARRSYRTETFELTTDV